jgi:hypothetical protein
VSDLQRKLCCNVGAWCNKGLRSWYLNLVARIRASVHMFCCDVMQHTLTTAEKPGHVDGQRRTQSSGQCCNCKEQICVFTATLRHTAQVCIRLYNSKWRKNCVSLKLCASCRFNSHPLLSVWRQIIRQNIGKRPKPWCKCHYTTPGTCAKTFCSVHYVHSDRRRDLFPVNGIIMSKKGVLFYRQKRFPEFRQPLLQIITSLTTAVLTMWGLL